MPIFTGIIPQFRIHSEGLLPALCVDRLERPIPAQSGHAHLTKGLTAGIRRNWLQWQLYEKSMLGLTVQY